MTNATNATNATAKAIRPRSDASAEDVAPKAKMAKPGVVDLADLDMTKIELGEVKDGSIGDKFVELRYNGGQLQISFAKLPNYTRSPFKAGPAKNKEGTVLGDRWGMVVEISDEQYKKWSEFETFLCKTMCKDGKKDQLFVPKKGKGLTDDAFEEKFNSIVKAPDVERGYKASMRLFVQHDPMTDAQGKSKAMPKISHHILSDDNTLRKVGDGTVHDLDAKIAIVPVAALSRGVYAGGTGWGVKMTLQEAYILDNKSGGAGSLIDTSNVTILEPSNDPAVTDQSMIDTSKVDVRD